MSPSELLASQTLPPRPEEQDGGLCGIHRACLGLVDCGEVETVHERLLAAVTNLTGAQGVAVWHGGVIGRRPYSLRSLSGLLDRESVPRELSMDDRSARTRRLLDGACYLEGGRAVYAPMVLDGDVIGVVMASDRVSGPFEEAAAGAVRALADFGAVGLRNAMRVAQLQRSGLRDRDTAAYNVGYFIDYAGKEVYKARRYGRRFSVVTIEMDNLDVLRMAVSANAGKMVQRRLIMAVQGATRDSDICSKVSDGTFYLLLPETDRFGAQMVTRRAVSAFFQSPEVADLSVPPSITVGIGAWPRDGEDLDEILETCARRRLEARHSPYRRLRLENHGFWSMVDLLLEGSSSSAATGDAGRRGPLPDCILQALLVEAAKDSARSPQNRGLIYLGADPESNRVLREGLLRFEDTSTRVHLLARRIGSPIDNAAVTTVVLPKEERLSRFEFFLLLSEGTAYAWLRGEGSRAYHTSDVTLVEALVTRLQEFYDLQRQI